MLWLVVDIVVLIRLELSMLRKHHASTCVVWPATHSPHLQHKMTLFQLFIFVITIYFLAISFCTCFIINVFIWVIIFNMFVILFFTHYFNLYYRKCFCFKSKFESKIKRMYLFIRLRKWQHWSYNVNWYHLNFWHSCGVDWVLIFNGWSNLTWKSVLIESYIYVLCVVHSSCRKYVKVHCYL